MRKFFVPAVFAVALMLGGCGEPSGHSKAQDAGIPVSYSDYYDMCDVHSGEWVKDMDVERRWTQEQHQELWDIIADDPRCQPDGE